MKNDHRNPTQHINDIFILRRINGRWIILIVFLHSPADDLNDFKSDPWLFRALRLHAFIRAHNGHRIEISAESDDEAYLLDDFEEQYPWPSEEFLAINKKETRFKKLMACINNFFDYIQFRLQHTKRVEQALHRSQVAIITLEKKLRDLTIK